MKKYLIFLVLAVGLCAAGWFVFQDKAPAGWTTFTDSQDRFSFDYPSTWKFAELSEGNFIVSVFDPATEVRGNESFGFLRNEFSVENSTASSCEDSDISITVDGVEGQDSGWEEWYGGIGRIICLPDGLMLVPFVRDAQYQAELDSVLATFRFK